MYYSRPSEYYTFIQLMIHGMPIYEQIFTSFGLKAKSAMRIDPLHYINISSMPFDLSFYDNKNEVTHDWGICSSPLILINP